MCGVMLCGCQWSPKVYPEIKRRSLTELYYEAVAASSNAPDRSGAVATGLTPGANTPAEPILLPPAQPLDSFPLQPTNYEAANAGARVRRLSSRNVDQRIGMANRQAATSTEARMTTALPSGAAAGWRASSERASKGPVVRKVAYRSIAAPTVTEFFEDTDLRQALQSLAQQAETTVIIDEQAAGVVTAVIEDEPFETALRKVLLPLGLVYRQTAEGEYLIGVPDPASPLFGRLAEQIEFRPLHLSPTELAGLVPERDRKFLQVVEQRNRILIEAPAEIADDLVTRLQQFDTPIPQVELEAIVCVIAPDSGFKSGLDWNHALTLNGSEVFNFGLAGLALNGRGSGVGFDSAFSDFSVTSAFVKLLAQEGYLAIRAAPRVTARDGDQARISITRESFFSTQPQSDNAFFRQEIEQVEAGIELDITPVIRGDNITVKIEKAEVSEDIRTSQINSNITENPFPQINRRTVSTTVHVKDGQTVVIGGLVQRQVVDRIAQVPVLGELPYFGRAFQTVEQKEQDAEVVIFISPRLVHPSGSPPNSSSPCLP
ncbi:MAG: hypothetical protein Fues2KO_10400 [Fuerstiella sp.]